MVIKRLAAAVSTAVGINAAGHLAAKAISEHGVAGAAKRAATGGVRAARSAVSGAARGVSTVAGRVADAASPPAADTDADADADADADTAPIMDAEVVPEDSTTPG